MIVTAFGSVATTTFDELGVGADAAGAALAEATGAEGAADGAGAGGGADADAAGAGEGLSSHATRDNAIQTREAALFVLMWRASSPRERERHKDRARPGVRIVVASYANRTFEKPGATIAVIRTGFRIP